MDVKRCNKCGEEKPLDADHWHWRTTSGKRAPHTPCKPCRNAQARETRKAEPEAHRERRREAARKAREADPEGFRARHSEGEHRRRTRRLEEDPEGFRAKRAAESLRRRKRRRTEQLTDVVRLVRDQLADGRSVEDVAEALLAADVRVYGGLYAGQTAPSLDVQ